jgi:hypothetical protein
VNFLHLEIGDAVAQQAAGLCLSLKDMHVVPGACQLLRACQAGRPRANHRDLLAGLALRQFGFYPALSESTVGDLAFDCLDRHRLLSEVERTSGFAWRRTDAAGNFGEIVGRMQVADRLLPIAAIDEIVPVGDLVVDRTTVVAIGDAAIHAARRLIARGFLGKRDDELAVMANAIGGRRVAPVAPIDFEKARYLTHSTIPPH